MFLLWDLNAQLLHNIFRASKVWIPRRLQHCSFGVRDLEVSTSRSAQQYGQINGKDHVEADLDQTD